MKLKLESIIAELEGIEREWNGRALAEKIGPSACPAQAGGNVVKQARCKGTATGLRIANNVLSAHLVASDSVPGSSSGIIMNDNDVTILSGRPPVKYDTR